MRITIGLMKNAKSILIVDDLLEIRFLLNMILRKHFDQLHFAHDGEEALKIVNREKIHLIMTDLEMPGKDGKWLLGELKKDQRKIPTIVLSASLEVDQEELLKLGADAFLPKPFSISELIEKVRELLNY